MDVKNKDTFARKAMVIAFALCMMIPAATLIGAVPTFGATTEDTVDAAPGHSSILYLKYGQFDTKNGEPTMPNSIMAAPIANNVMGSFIVRTNGQVTDEWKAELQLNGAEIICHTRTQAHPVRGTNFSG